MDKFIGLRWLNGGRDYDGVDCWGLVYLYYRDVLNINLPLYPGIDADNPYSVLRKVCKENDNTTFFKIVIPQEGDLVLLNDSHIGIYKELSHGCVLHCNSAGSELIPKRYLSLSGYSSPVYYRHKELL